MEFCSTHYGIDFSKEEAQSALLSYLKDRSSPILAAAVEGEPIPKPAQPIKSAEYLVRSFIGHLCEADPKGFEYLETIVKGNMLASVLYFPELGKVTRRFGRVEIYFDTSFLLRALGLAPRSMQISYRELMALLYELNAELRCFEHTVEEMRGILDFAARALRDRKSLRYALGEALEFFVEQNYRSSDVELIIARLEQSLSALRVQVKRRPPYEDKFCVDEGKLQSVLQEVVGYRKEETLRHDLDSLTAIHRLRYGQFPLAIETCNAIFVTTNFSLVQASAQFFREEYRDDAVSVPHCIMNHVLTTLAWLKKPLRAPELPQKRIIADCYAALSPSDALWRLYLREIGRLQQRGDILQHDYDLLRFSMEARNLLLDITLGDAEAFTEGTVREVLERAQAGVRAETEAALYTERERRLEVEQRAKDAEARFETHHRTQLERLRGFSARVGKWVGQVALAIIVTLQLLVAYLALPDPFPELPGGWWRWIAPILLVALSVLEIADLTFGVTLSSYVRRLEVSVSRVVEQFLRKVVIPQEVV